MKKRVNKIICFDLDGTLVYSRKCRAKAYNHAIKKAGLKQLTEKTLASNLGVVGDVWLHNLFPYLRNSEITAIINDQRRYNKKYLKHIRPVKGCLYVLTELKKKYKLAIVSNCREKTIIETLRAAKISAKFFDVIIGNDSVKHPKPAPDEIIKTEKLARLKAEYMVGDTIYDIIAAKRAKVKAIGVLTGSTSKYQLQKYKPKHILQDIRGLLKIIK